MNVVCLSTSDMFGAMLFVFGTFINVFSLTFFISRPKIDTNEFLFLSLNSLNLVICLYLFSSIPAIRDTYVYHIAYQFHDLVLYMSLFIACLMSITRMILLIYPSLQPLLKIRYLLFSILFLMVLLILPFMIQPGYFLSGRSSNPLWATYYSVVGLVVVIVALVCNGIMVGSLKYGTSHEVTPDEKRDTVTVLILVFTKALFVAPYCLLYLISSIVSRSSLKYTGQVNNNVLGDENALIHFLDVWANYAMPINSIINVFVFFVRIRELRMYGVRVIKVLYKLTHCDCQTRKQDPGNRAVPSSTPPPSPRAPQADTDDLTPV